MINLTPRQAAEIGRISDRYGSVQVTSLKQGSIAVADYQEPHWRDQGIPTVGKRLTLELDEDGRRLTRKVAA